MDKITNLNEILAEQRQKIEAEELREQQKRDEKGGLQNEREQKRLEIIVQQAKTEVAQALFEKIQHNPLEWLMDNLIRLISKSPHNVYRRILSDAVLLCRRNEMGSSQLFAYLVSLLDSLWTQAAKEVMDKKCFFFTRSDEPDERDYAELIRQLNAMESPGMICGVGVLLKSIGDNRIGKLVKDKFLELSRKCLSLKNLNEYEFDIIQQDEKRTHSFPLAQKN